MLKTRESSCQQSCRPVLRENEYSTIIEKKKEAFFKPSLEKWENPRDRGAWWAAMYGVAQSRTWLKWLSCSSSSREMGSQIGGKTGII